MLRKKQIPIAEKIVERIEDKILLNIPTGGGKTYILLGSAIKLLEKYKDRKIIISVPNNNLVRDMVTTAKEGFGINSDEMSIVIGKDNYIDKKKLIFHYQTGNLKQYISKSSLSKYMSFIKDKNVLFFDEFEQHIKYLDYSNRFLVQEILKTENNKEQIEGLESKLIISNHFYVMNKVVHDDSFNTEKYIFLFDEVHELTSVAESILEQSFSLFEFHSSLKYLKEILAEQKTFNGKDTLNKNIHSLMAKTYKTQRKFIRSTKVGEYTTEESSVSRFSDEISNLLSSSICKNTIQKIKSLMEDSILKKEVLNSLSYQLSIYKRGVSISAIEQSMKGIYYSPSRGYPTLKASSHSIENILHYKFWKKIDYMAGLSATVSYSPKPFASETVYAYFRLGLYEKGKTTDVIAYDRIFDKSRVNIHLPDDEIPERESVYSQGFKKESSKYYNYIVDYIHKTNDGKNSMVICGGYQEANTVYRIYAAKYGDREMLCASPDTKAINLIEMFKETGGILFATRNFNTGISLEKEQLEKLYILNLPYPIFTSIRWFTLKEKQPKYYYSIVMKEMLIALMQTLGRLQRTDIDKGDIYLLDERYNGPAKSRIMNILEYYGKIEKRGDKREKSIKIEDRRDEANNRLRSLLLG